MYLNIKVINWITKEKFENFINQYKAHFKKSSRPYSSTSKITKKNIVT